MFATNSDRGGLTDVKSIALPQLYNADSAAAVAKRSAMRPYPTGGRGWEMSGDNHDRPISEGLEAAHLVGLIEPEDIANIAVFLASEEARMVTGHVYPVDSGVTIS
jgi:NAD(P)-dependent dehydrogenase (short-subunit alcohol dehydrogenase family)